MRSDPVFTKARKLMGRRKYSEAIRILENEAVRYQDSFRYYYLLGGACLRAGDFGGASTYFSRARKIRKRDVQVLLGLAAISLQRSDTAQAVEVYLEVQELDPGNDIAQRALDVIRRYGNSDEMNAWIEEGNLRRLFPPLPREPFSPRRIFAPVLGVVLGLAALGGILFLTGLFRPFQDRNGRTGYGETFLSDEERDAPVQPGGNVRYELSGGEVLAAYEKARRLFNDFRDEEAKVELNRILESNASEILRNRARIFLSYTETPSFASLKNSFDYQTVDADPFLYRDCYVIWEGLVQKVETGSNSTSFDLLVEYDERSVQQGNVPVVPVTFDYALNVNTTRPLRVLGRIIPVSDQEGKKIRLQGIALQQSQVPARSGPR
jgi:tetratricopeptide (TPR) repeat protein